jgi:adenylosuccinate synthase
VLIENGFNLTATPISAYLRVGFAAMIETPQGMSLSLNNGFYPYCTSREVSVSQSLSDAGLHPHDLHKTLMTMRTFPIRVGNIVDDEGNVIGFSGPVYPDQQELSWEKDFPNVTPEKTTVTQRVRRIFTFSPSQYYEALDRLNPDYVHIGFCDYFKDAETLGHFDHLLRHIEGQARVYPQKVYAFGPQTTDVYDYNQAMEKYNG